MAAPDFFEGAGLKVLLMLAKGRFGTHQHLAVMPDRIPPGRRRVIDLPIRPQV
jgi:hypothetical protein